MEAAPSRQARSFSKLPLAALPEDNVARMSDAATMEWELLEIVSSPASVFSDPAAISDSLHERVLELIALRASATQTLEELELRLAEMRLARDQQEGACCACSRQALAVALRENACLREIVSDYGAARPTRDEPSEVLRTAVALSLEGRLEVSSAGGGEAFSGSCESYIVEDEASPRHERTTASPKMSPLLLPMAMLRSALWGGELFRSGTTGSPGGGGAQAPRRLAAE